MDTSRTSRDSRPRILDSLRLHVSREGRESSVSSARPVRPVRWDYAEEPDGLGAALEIAHQLSCKVFVTASGRCTYASRVGCAVYKNGPSLLGARCPQLHMERSGFSGWSPRLGAHHRDLNSCAGIQSMLNVAQIQCFPGSSFERFLRKSVLSPKDASAARPPQKRT
jgi:hypothetical protein